MRTALKLALSADFDLLSGDEFLRIGFDVDLACHMPMITEVTRVDPKLHVVSVIPCVFGRLRSSFVVANLSAFASFSDSPKYLPMSFLPLVHAFFVMDL